MKILFLILIYAFFTQLRVEAAEAKAFISGETTENLKLHRSLNDVLAESKLEIFDVENRTNTPVTLKVYDFYHETFDEEDFASGGGILTVFDDRYQVVSSAGRALSGKKTASQVLIKPYREKSEKTATVLLSSTTILPGAHETIRAIESSYIGRLICEASDKYIFYETSLEREIKFITKQNPYALLSRAICEKNLFEMATSNEMTVPFLEYLSKVVFVAHKSTFKERDFSIEKFYRKLDEVHQAGLQIFEDRAKIPAAQFDLKIPQISHTLVTKKREEGTPFLSENQRRWFMKSINTLPNASGWKHILWVSGAITSISPEDLGDLNGKVEVRSIFASGLPDLSDISELIELGLNRHAAAFLQYAVLAVHGGVIRGINTEIIQDITAICTNFHFCAGLEVNTARMIDSGFLASTPCHPITMRALELSRYHTRRPPAYLLGIKSSRLLREKADKQLADYHIKYGNGVLSLAFQQHGEATRDMIFGPNVFSPLRSAPEITSFDDPRLSLTSETYAINYAEDL